MVPKTAKILIAKKTLKKKHTKAQGNGVKKAQQKLLDSLSHR